MGSLGRKKKRNQQWNLNSHNTWVGLTLFFHLYCSLKDCNSSLALNVLNGKEKIFHRYFKALKSQYWELKI